MAISLALIILLGLFSDHLFRRIKLPGLIGMLLVGIFLGPYVFNVIDPVILTVSSDFRMIALIVILLRAGFATKKDTLNRIGKTAALMGFVPAVFEGAAITFIAPFFFDISLLESAILGFIVAAVSPAIVVPMMLRFIESNKGAKKGIPTLLLASSSLDNVFAIVISSALIGMYSGKGTNIFMKLLEIPVSISLGIALGAAIGFALYRVFKKYQPRATKEGMIVIGSAILLTWVEKTARPFVAVSALSGVIAIGFIILEKSEPIAHKISRKLGKIWVFAEILLFVLVGAQVNIHVAWNAGLAGLVIIFIGLIARSAGTYISLIKTGFSIREKLFCMASYIPKATVQAAIGAVPLSLGVKSGDIILAVAVLAILFTAPLGAIGMNIIGEKVLEK
ncbi:MAG: NhaP-type Na+(K+)/H+ antiporter [Nitrospirae bacterium]|nr:MAG: NhaP-type Na+(K+)/H+ antiporter [Nitrospirota bacterium]